MKTQTRASKHRKHRKPWPQVRHVKYKGGRDAWMVDARTNGKGERLFFDTKQEAESKADSLRIERRNNGTSALAIPAKLRIEAVECAARLAAVGASLIEATDYFILHAKPEAGAKSVADVIADFLREKERAGRRPQYLRVQKYVLGNFGATFGPREIHTISHEDISDWMDAQAWKLRAPENYRRDLSNLFGFAIRHKHCAMNPTSQIERATLDDTPPGILTVSEAARLLSTANSSSRGILLPYVASFAAGNCPRSGSAIARSVFRGRASRRHWRNAKSAKSEKQKPRPFRSGAVGDLKLPTAYTGRREGQQRTCSTSTSSN